MSAFEGVSTLCLSLLVFFTQWMTLSAEVGKPCNITELFSCGPNELCFQRSSTGGLGTCTCIPGFGRVNGQCQAAPVIPTEPPRPHSTNIPPSAEPHTDTPSKNAVVAGVLVPLILVCATIAAVVYFGRRYNWLRRLRQLRPLQRRSNDLIIGRPDDDDDPIA